MPLSIFCNSPYNEKNNRAIKIFIQMPGDLLFHPRGEYPHALAPKSTSLSWDETSRVRIRLSCTTCSTLLLLILAQAIRKLRPGCFAGTHGAGP